MLKIEINEKDLVLMKYIGEALVLYQRAEMPSTGSAPDPEPVHEVQTHGEEQEVMSFKKEPKPDYKGVAFDANFCGEAAEPFYTTGKLKCQWKAKRGLFAGKYNDWYAEQLKNAPPPTIAEEKDFDAARAFSENPEPSPITEPGELLKWVAENQTAGHLTSQQITAAYDHLNLDLGRLFTDEGAAQKLHQTLLGWVKTE